MKEEQDEEEELSNTHTIPVPSMAPSNKSIKYDYPRCPPTPSAAHADGDAAEKKKSFALTAIIKERCRSGAEGGKGSGWWEAGGRERQSVEGSKCGPWDSGRGRRNSVQCWDETLKQKLKDGLDGNIKELQLTEENDQGQETVLESFKVRGGKLNRL